MGLRPNTYTYGQLSVEVKRLFGDESGVQLEPGDILRWANQGQQEIVTRNKVLKARADTPTVAAQDLYTFPDQDIYEVSSILLNGSPLPNIPYAEAERQILAYDPAKTEAGQPQFWYTWGNEFWLWPVPDKVYTMRMLYSKSPPMLTGSDAEVLSVPNEYFSVLVDFILAKAYEMDEDWTASNAKSTAFENGIAVQGEKERDSADLAYPVIAEVDYSY